MNIQHLDAVPCADTIVHATFLSNTAEPFERLLDADMDIGDIVRVYADGYDEPDEPDFYIVTDRERALVLSSGGDTLCIFITLQPCVPNNERI